MSTPLVEIEIARMGRKRECRGVFRSAALNAASRRLIRVPI